MDDRGYVAQALFDRLSEEGTRFRVLGDTTSYPERAPPLVQAGHLPPDRALVGDRAALPSE